MATEYNRNLLFQNNWSVAPLGACIIFAVLLWYSFFNAPLSSYWQEFDNYTFLLLNGSLDGHEGWAKIAAYANTKWYDVASAVALVAILFIFAAFSKQSDFSHRLAAVAFAGLYMAIMTFARREFAIMDHDRLSPSLTDLSFINLREIFPLIKPKVDSRNTFPGDHGIACLILTGLFTALAGWRWGLLMFTLAVPLFILPRLIGGAHWATDVVVGGLACSLVIVALAIFTPFAARCSELIHKLILRFMHFLPRRN